MNTAQKQVLQISKFKIIWMLLWIGLAVAFILPIMSEVMTRGWSIDVVAIALYLAILVVPVGIGLYSLSRILLWALILVVILPFPVWMMATGWDYDLTDAAYVLAAVAWTILFWILVRRVDQAAKPDTISSQKKT